MRAQLKLQSLLLAGALTLQLQGCASKEQKQFVTDYNQASSMEFNMPYVDSQSLLVGYDLTTRSASEKQLVDAILSSAVPKSSDGQYLMTNTTLMGALCNPDNNLGFYINPYVAQTASTLTVDNVNTMDGAVQSYMNGQLIGQNLGETNQDKSLSQKYVTANLIYSVLPSRNFEDKAINPYQTTITRAHAMVALMNAFYGSGVIPEDYPDDIDTSKLDSAIQDAVDKGLLNTEAVPYKFLTENNKALSWMDQFAYLKVSDGEMGAIGLFKEITFGELQYMIANMLIREGTIPESAIIHWNEEVDKKLSAGYTVKTIDEIVEKSAKSNKLQNSVIPGKTLAVLRALYIDGAENTVEPDLYSTYVQMMNLGFNDGLEKIYDTVTVNEFYKSLLNISEYYKQNALTWVDYKWVDPNPPVVEPEPEPEYLDFDGAVDAWLNSNVRNSEVGQLVGTENTEGEEAGNEETAEDTEKFTVDTFVLGTITESEHSEPNLTGINLTNEQYEQLYTYIRGLGIKADNIGDFCKNPIAKSYITWLTNMETVENMANLGDSSEGASTEDTQTSENTQNSENTNESTSEITE